MEEKETLENQMIDDAEQTDLGSHTEDFGSQTEDFGSQTEDVESKAEDFWTRTEDFESQPDLEDIPEPMFKRADSVYLPTDPPKNRNTPIVIVFVLLLLLVIGLGVFVIVSLPRQLEKEMEEITEAQSETGSSFFDAWMPDISDDESDGAGVEDTESDNIDTEAEDTDSVQTIDWDENWQEQFINHSPEEFSGPYYDSAVDCIDESVSYAVNREFFEYEDEENNVCIRVSYVQLEGDIPNLENINKELKTNALMYAEYYEENSTTVLKNIENSEMGYWVETFQYVTYNDEDQISVVLNEHLSYGYYTQPLLMATNINLATGSILDNTRILQLDEDFGREFRERSEKQNGESQGTEIFTDDEIINMLQDEDALILFYTPIGLELGYSYNEDYYSGWITISMQDYEKYLAGM